MDKLIVFLAVFFLFYSCDNLKKSDITGAWIVTKSLREGKNTKGIEFRGNWISFSLDRECGMPADSSHKIGLGHGSICNWDILTINTKNYLIIKTNSLFFNDTFEIISHENRMLILGNKTKHLECKKLL